MASGLSERGKGLHEATTPIARIQNLQKTDLKLYLLHSVETELAHRDKLLLGRQEHLLAQPWPSFSDLNDIKDITFRSAVQTSVRSQALHSVLRHFSPTYYLMLRSVLSCKLVI